MPDKKVKLVIEGTSSPITGTMTASGTLELELDPTTRAGMTISYTTPDEIKVTFSGQKTLTVDERLRLIAKASVGILSKDDVKSIIESGASLTMIIDKNTSASFSVNWKQASSGPNITGKVGLEFTF